MEVFLGTIQAFAFPYAPVGWAACQGQLLPVNPNVALFSIIGVAYGGNGQTTFGLPNLQGRVAVGQGTLPGTQSAYTMGQAAGAETVTLTNGQMPLHIHTLSGTNPLMVSDQAGTTATPTATENTLGALADPSLGSALNYAYNNQIPNIPLNTGPGGGATGAAGGNQPFSILQPYQVVNYCIAIQGIFPSRN